MLKYEHLHYIETKTVDMVKLSIRGKTITDRSPVSPFKTVCVFVFVKA